MGSFKALGGVYAVAQLISQRWQHAYLSELMPEQFQQAKVLAFANSLTFVCASAGNHGLAVAAGARLFGAKSRIHLCHRIPEQFAQRLKQKGATVVRSGDSYEESVEAAIEDCANSDDIHLADSSWPGYVHAPRLVMEGYSVMAQEMCAEFTRSKRWPSHVFLQAGVGGLAAAITLMIRKNWSVQPEIIVVEPEFAACLGQSVKQDKIVSIVGPPSNMGRLDCKTPSILALEVLAGNRVGFVTVSDQQAQRACFAAQSLGFTTTPSGAAGLAAVIAHSKPTHRPLVIITEGGL